ncbi:MAG: hypothetical protein PUF48_03560 [Oscillospiraceae bacterium]|nr:hypothetical protein [Oscillospiraceae bacterium]
MQNKKCGKTFSRFCFIIIRALIKFFYPTPTLYKTENIPSEPCIIVGNHTQMNGPICAEIFLDVKRKIWCASQMMYLKEVPSYAYKDFWSGKPKAIRWFYKILSFIIAPLSVCIFNNANTIPVFRDNRVIKTFKQTVEALKAGDNVVIFPECYEAHNHIINNFQDRFIDVAKLYYKRTGKAVKFVPMYIAPTIKSIYFGKPVEFDYENSSEEERRRIADYLMDEITDIAVNLPLHKVVPYENTPSRKYRYNRTER